MSELLASVHSASEAEIAVRCGADIIDCKNPFDGALGALSAQTIREIVAVVDNRCLVSATTGNEVSGSRQLREVIAETADCGVDYVKFGLFDPASVTEHLPALRTTSAPAALIAVCFADRHDPTPWLAQLADAGLTGVMIDTSDKRAGSLTEIWSRRQIAALVCQAHNLGLLCGLAGRLRQEDIPKLLPFNADYLGFRSALCGGDRSKGLEPAAMLQVRDAIPRSETIAAPTLAGAACSWG